MKKLIFTVSALIVSAYTFAQTNWNLDKSHSNVSFSVSHMVVSETAGKFKKFDATVVSPKVDNFDDAKVEFTIDAASINTEDEGRDKHLQSPDFFDVAKYPTITFKSTSFKKVDDKTYKIIGTLTMHGTSKQVEFTAKYSGIIKDPYGFYRAGFRLSGVLNRKDYGLNFDAKLDSGGLVVGDEVNFGINIEVTKK